MKAEQIKSFLEKLDKLGSGEKALFRRNAAAHYERADFHAAGAFARLLPPDTPSYEEAPLFSAVCVRCLWKTPGGGLPFPAAVSMLKRQQGDSETVEKRFLSLLDESLNEESLFCIKFYRLSHMLCAAGIGVDWESLCGDLLRWNRAERYVQRQWMRTYFHVPAQETDGETTKKNEEDEKSC